MGSLLTLPCDVAHMTADHAEPDSPKRRRAVLVVSVLAFGVLAVTGFRLSQPSPVERLQAYVGQDLRKLNEDEQITFDALLGQLAPEARVFTPPARPKTWDPRAWRDYLTAKPSPRFFPRQSWYAWHVTDGRARDRLVLFQGTPLFMIPGASAARIVVFDSRGKPLSTCEFLTGWRITIEDARWLEDSGHGFPCLLVCSRSSILGDDVAAQYYAFLDDTFALVRLEDSAGQFVRVTYEYSHHTIGPSIPERTPEQWEAALRSSEQAEVLRTLVWLGGDHSDPRRREKDTSAESVEDATRVLETRGRPGIHSMVEALTRSEDRWVQEAAQHAWEAIQGGDR